jgi:hypothetical protein
VTTPRQKNGHCHHVIAGSLVYLFAADAQPKHHIGESGKRQKALEVIYRDRLPLT